MKKVICIIVFGVFILLGGLTTPQPAQADVVYRTVTRCHFENGVRVCHRVRQRIVRRHHHRRHHHHRHYRHGER